MLLLFASALYASAPVSPARPQVQARATVRIVAGTQLHLDGRHNGDAPKPRPAKVELARGSGKVDAKLIEFE